MLRFRSQYLKKDVPAAGTRMLGLRTRIPPGPWMFVLYSKDERQKPGQSGQRSTGKVETEQTKILLRV